MANQKFQNALNRVPQACPPIWFMRQAGRYHQHYQKLRKEHSFMDLCKKADLAAEVAMGPIEDFDFDVAILFSDLLFPLEAMGMGLSYEPAPKLGWHLDDSNLSKLVEADKAIELLHFQKEAMIATRARLPDSKSLIGFVGSPWTLFGYAVDGQHKGSLIESKKKLHLFNNFCEVLMPLLEKNIQLQFEGGAEVVMIFDTAAGELSPDIYHSYVAPQLSKLAKTFTGKLAYYAKGTTSAHYQNSLFEEDNWAGVGFDHRWDICELFETRKFGFVQGNIDQALLTVEPKHFERHLQQYLEPILRLSPEKRAAWVCGLGHGMLPACLEENVRIFIKTVRELMR